MIVYGKVKGQTFVFFFLLYLLTFLTIGLVLMIINCDLNSSNLSKEFHDWYLHHRHISTNTLVLVYAIHDSKKILNGRFVLNYFDDDTVLTCDNVSLFYKFHRHKKFFEWSEWLWNWRPSKDSLYFDCVVYPDV